MTDAPYSKREKKIPGGWVSAALLFCFGSLVLLLSLSLIWQVLSPIGRSKCSDFSSWSQANFAYRQGAYWLDGNDKDGIPCEDLYE